MSLWAYRPLQERGDLTSRAQLPATPAADASEDRKAFIDLALAFFAESTWEPHASEIKAFEAVCYASHVPRLGGPTRRLVIFLHFSEIVALFADFSTQGCATILRKNRFSPPHRQRREKHFFFAKCTNGSSSGDA